MGTGNRVLWTIVGAVLLVAGGLTAAGSAGWLPVVDTESPLLWSELIERWRSWEPWVWLIVAIAGAVIAWLGWRLIRAQLRRAGGPLMDNLTMRAPDGRGRTVVGRSTLTRATEQELDHIPGVHGALVRLLGEHEGPEVRARLDVQASAGLSTVAADVAKALNRFTVTSGLEPQIVDVTVRVDGGPPPRVS